MYQPVEPPIERYLERGQDSHFDDSLIRVYFLNPVTSVEAASTCQRAHDTYARDILGCPSSEIEAPDLFKIYDSERNTFHSLAECWKDFMIFLQSTYSDQNFPKSPTEFPLGFVVLTASDSQRATLVCCFKEDEDWHVGSCLIPIDAELGMQAQAMKYSEDEFPNFARQYDNDLPGEIS
ncbi:hypothetical protein QM012_008670 [Aureobasidium pullulans]|uniref:Uncharacterized protein n=1 Tax=Aureobasidium pullulans TaxID=5580 RepID=A0ABR0TK56_AURPU